MTTLRSVATLGLGLTVLAAPLAGGAQVLTTRVGLVAPDEEPRFSEIARSFRRGLHDQGHRESALEILERRVRRGDSAGAETAARTLAAQRVVVILAVGSTLAGIARRAAPEVPIVFVTPGDPVAAGLAASLARPGRNMTAVMFEYPELSGEPQHREGARSWHPAVGARAGGRGDPLTAPAVVACLGLGR